VGEITVRVAIAAAGFEHDQCCDSEKERQCDISDGERTAHQALVAAGLPEG
jgi:hypothetical protein